MRGTTFDSRSSLAYDIQSQFWIDGTLPSSAWNWSGQAISWYFTRSERAVYGNGTSLKLQYNSLNRTYQISDDNGSKPMNYICEYQGKSDSSIPEREKELDRDFLNSSLHGKHLVPKQCDLLSQCWARTLCVPTWIYR